MTRTTINLALQIPDNENYEGHKHYFTLTQTKIINAVQFYKHMGIDYIKKDIFQTFNIFICQNHEFLRNNLSSY